MEWEISRHRPCYWKGDEGQLSDLGYRLTGSSDLYQNDGRRPYASINFITAHDGFTLHDLVSYNRKHNQTNGENNQDGTNDNQSWNMGAEGPTDDPEINRARERQTRNLLATLILSQGVPMISGGDEIARTQQGNNNAYCQDNEISWYDWEPSEAKAKLLDFTSSLIHLRKSHPNLRRRKFFVDRSIHNTAGLDIAWYGNDGNELSSDAWRNGWMRTIGLLLNGKTLGTSDALGNDLIDDTFLLLLNAYHETVPFVLPPPPGGGTWEQLMNTDDLERPFDARPVSQEINLTGRSMMLLVERNPETPASSSLE
jgi:isoamylase